MSQMQVFYPRAAGSVKDRKKITVRYRAVNTQDYQAITVLRDKLTQKWLYFLR
jgi:hypothetical protein